MTIQQFRIALEVAKTGSISRAASNLFLSQPNASNSLRALESELGYSIFIRTNSGVEVTERGRRFLAHARTLLFEVEQMEDLKNEAHVHRLRLGILSYAPTVEAFLKLCAEYAGKEKADLLCLNMSDMDGIRAVSNTELDLMATLISDFDIERVRAIVKSYHLYLEFIKKIPLNINVRQGHPLLSADGTIDLSELCKYPYVAYEQIPNLVEKASSIVDTRIRYKFRIAVDERDTRCRIVSTTDAFSIGCQLPEELLERYRIATVRVTDVACGLYCIMRSGDQKREETRRYIELLQAEVAEL